MHLTKLECQPHIGRRCAASPPPRVEGEKKRPFRGEHLLRSLFCGSRARVYVGVGYRMGRGPGVVSEDAGTWREAL